MSTVLARLAPKTLVPTGEGFGGFLKLEQCDVAYALAGLPLGPAALLRAMYALDHGQSNLRDLYLWAWQEAAAIAVDNGWEVPKRVSILSALSARAVDELVHPQLTMCAHCNGSGGVQPNQYNPDGSCTPCANTGKHNPTDEEMAAMFKLTLADWRNIWLPRYVKIYGRLLEWHSTGERHVRKRLKGEN